MIHPADHIDDDLLSAFVDDQLTPDEAARARAHLTTCSVCQERLDEFRSVAALLRRLPEVEPPRDFSLGPRLVVDPPNVIRLRRWYVVTRTAAASLAAIFVALSAGAFYADSRPAAGSATQFSQPRVAVAPAAPEVALSAPTPAVRAAAPAAAPPQAGAAAAVARAVPPSPQPDDQVVAATRVSPLPTPAPTPQLVSQPSVSPAVNSVPLDSAAPLRNGAIGVGILAVLTLLATLAVRQRLRRTTSHL